jgi:antitoxin (DNA-binding transcriptional repressor) of toxin-antitoxin stability system
MAVTDDDRPEVRLVAHCRRCHGWLVSAASVSQGIGPTCAVRERAEQRAAAAHELTLFDFAA